MEDGNILLILKKLKYEKGLQRPKSPCLSSAGEKSLERMFQQPWETEATEEMI